MDSHLANLVWRPTLTSSGVLVWLVEPGASPVAACLTSSHVLIRSHSSQLLRPLGIVRPSRAGSKRSESAQRPAAATEGSVIGAGYLRWCLARTRAPSPTVGRVRQRGWAGWRAHTIALLDVCMGRRFRAVLGRGAGGRAERVPSSRRPSPG